MDFKNKKVIVIGAGLSGIAAARLLLSAGAEVIIRDGNDKITPDAIKEKLNKEWEIVREHGIDSATDLKKLELCLGKEDYSDIKGADLIVVSPGIALDSDFMKPYMGSGVPVWGEVELAWSFEKGKVLAITGTNGKTTTTALLGKIMADALGDDKVIVVGNIGDPYTREVQLTSKDSVTVAEISSFMLETTHDFAPKVSAILNITPDHLDRHHTMEAYAGAKEDICKKSTPEDFIILNKEDERTAKYGERAVPEAVYFSSKQALKGGIYYKDGKIYSDIDGKDELLIKEEEANIVGLHNMENIMAAAAMAIKAGIGLESIRKSIREFTAVEHRIEYVTEIDGVVFYNDSKGTNPDAAIKGIEAMTRPTVLIGGGYDKNSEYDEWIKSCVGRVKALVLIGATAGKIRDCALKYGIENIHMKDTFEEAVDTCFELSEEGDAVLLSPACASWGMFPNFEERGRIFKELVRSREHK